MALKFLGGDSSDNDRTTSNSKSNLHNSLLSSTVYYTTCTLCSALHSNATLIRPQNLSHHFDEQTEECRYFTFIASLSTE